MSTCPGSGRSSRIHHLATRITGRLYHPAGTCGLAISDDFWPRNCWILLVIAGCMKHIWNIYETHMKLVTDEKPESLRCILMHVAEFDASSPLGLGPIMVFRFSWPLCPGRNPPKDSCRSYAESIRIRVDILVYVCVWFIFDSFFFIHGCIVKIIANAMAAPFQLAKLAPTPRSGR